MEKLINIKQAADCLGVSSKTLRNWDKNHQFSAVRTFGGHRRYRLSDIEKFQAGKNDEKTDTD